MPFSFFQDRFVPAELAVVPVTDLAILRGYGVFDFFRIEEGQPVFIDEHLQRLERSASILGLDLPLPLDQLRERVGQLIAMNRLQAGGVRITLTGGNSPDGFLPGAPLLIITTHPVTWTANTEGLCLKTLSHRRQLPRAKTIDYLVPIRAWSLMKKEGFDDLLYIDEERVSECSRANFFIVTADRKLVTSDEYVLEGITRNKVIGLASDLLDVEIRPLGLDEVMEASEAFVTSTTKELTRVRAIDRQVFDGPAPVYELLSRRFSGLRSRTIAAPAR